MNNLSIFPNTAFGKTLKTVVILAISGAIASVITYITNNPSLFNWNGYAVSSLVIIVLRAIEKINDPNIPNV